jgi:hypothetical protein
MALPGEGVAVMSRTTEQAKVPWMTRGALNQRHISYALMAVAMQSIRFLMQQGQGGSLLGMQAQSMLMTF